MGKQGETKGNRKISEDIIISRQGDTWENIEKQGKHRQKGRNRGKHRKTEEIWENIEKQGKT